MTLEEIIAQHVAGLERLERLNDEIAAEAIALAATVDWQVPAMKRLEGRTRAALAKIRAISEMYSRDAGVVYRARQELLEILASPIYRNPRIK